jgi:hypothetical protein
MNISPIKCTFWHNHDNHVHKLENVETFCVVRNPIDRIISSYKYGCPSKCGKDLSVKDDIMSLNRFISSLEAKLNINPFYRDNHFRPQYMFAEKCGHIILFDNLQCELDELLKRYKIIPKPLLWKNKSLRVFKNISKDNINNENMKWIKEYYKKDFEMIAQLLHTRTHA